MLHQNKRLTHQILYLDTQTQTNTHTHTHTPTPLHTRLIKYSNESVPTNLSAKNIEKIKEDNLQN